MSDLTLMSNFDRSYENASFKYTQLINHRGTLISFALDSKRCLYYVVLDMSGQGNTNQSTQDVKHWSSMPSPVPFPAEITEVGYGDLTSVQMPVMYPEPSGGSPATEQWRSTTARLTADAQFQAMSDNEYIYLFRQSINAGYEDNPSVDSLSAPSSEQRLGTISLTDTTALIQNKVPVSLKTLVKNKTPHGQFLFQKATVTGEANDQWIVKDNGRAWLIKKEGLQLVVYALPSLVNNTLLVDRFVLAGDMLLPRMEVRYRRSGRRERPDSNTDTLGVRGMNDQPFFEPTRELRFVNRMEGGRFNVTLLPTQQADVSRWQIFAYNSATKQLDSYNIERSRDGLFNTQGTRYYTSPDEAYRSAVFETRPGKCPFTNQGLIELASRKGHAETCLKLNGSENDKANIAARSNNEPDAFRFSQSKSYTLEVWVKPQGIVFSALHGGKFYGVIVSGAGSLPGGKSTRRFGLFLRDDGAVSYGFSVGATLNSSNYKSNVAATSQAGLVKANQWHHIACSVEEVIASENNQQVTKCYARILVGGVQVAVQQITAPLYVHSSPLNIYFGRYYDNKSHRFSGQIDEVRIWNYARSAEAVRKTMHTRLLGDETGLKGYWRMDEGRGTTLHNAARSTAGYYNGQCLGTSWGTSGAPVGDSPGMHLTSFTFEGKTISAGPTATLYFQQELAHPAQGENSPKVKQNARVMLAVPTKPATGNNAKSSVSIIDFGVSREGRLAQIPDVVPLAVIDNALPANALSAADIIKRRQLEQERDGLLAAIVAEKNSPLSYPCNIRTLYEPSHNYSFTSSHLYLDEKLKAVSIPKKLNFRMVVDTKGLPLKAGNKFIYKLQGAPGSTTDEFHFNRLSGHDVYSIERKARAGLVLTLGVKREINPTYGFNLAHGNHYRVPTIEFTSGAGNNASQQWLITKAGNTQQASVYVPLLRKVEEKLAALKAKADPRYAMNLLAIDPFGLSVAGGQLEKITTDHTPQLFNNAEGKVVLYFREQSAGRFRAAYFDTTVQRKVIKVNLGAGEVMRFIARHAESDPKLTTIKLYPPNPNQQHDSLDYLLFKSLNGVRSEVIESFPDVPLRADMAADVINGKAGEALYIGKLTKARSANDTFIIIDHPLHKPLINKQWLLVEGRPYIIDRRSNKKVKIKGKTTEIPMSPGASHLFKKGSPVYLLPYNYQQMLDPQGTTHIGSRLLIAQATAKGILSGVKLSDVEEVPAKPGTWSANSPGNALSFSPGAIATSAQAPLRCGNEITIEAWVSSKLRQANSRVFTHHQTSALHNKPGIAPGFALGLVRRAGDTTKADVLFSVAGKTIRSKGPAVSKGKWVHIAASYRQSFALNFPGGNAGGYLACGGEDEWNLIEDMTLEVSLQLKANGVRRGVLSKGRFGNGQQNIGVPYALEVMANGGVCFSYEVQGKRYDCPSKGGLIKANQLHTISVVREIKVDQVTGIDLDEYDANSGLSNIELKPSKINQKKDDIDSAQRADYLKSKRNHAVLYNNIGNNNQPTGIKDLSIGGTRKGYTIMIYIDGKQVFSGNSAFSNLDSNSEPLEIGRVRNEDGPVVFQGIISEVRLWSKALTKDEIDQRMDGDEQSVSVWRFAEQQGTSTAESYSGRVAHFVNHLDWVKSTKDTENDFQLFINGQTVESVEHVSRVGNTTSPIVVELGDFQTSAGGYFKTTGNQKAVAEPLSGDIDEVRIWRTVRSSEQIQDNLFGRLKSEFSSLAAYYPCSLHDAKLLDSSPNGLDMLLSGSGSKKPVYVVHSQAPVSNDSALVKTAFLDLNNDSQIQVDSTPDIREYGDMQVRPDGTMGGVLKRCFAYIKDDKWHLVTGFKVGDLLTEWISQAQFNPQIKGYIEGPPPVPGENLTEGLQNPDTYGNFMDASSVTFEQSESVTTTVSSSKEGGFDSSFELGVEASILAKISILVAPFGLGIGFNPKIQFGGQFKLGIEGTNSISSSESISGGSEVNKSLALSLGGSWESSSNILNKTLHRRFIPSNMGMALVESDTADVYSMRLAHSKTLIGMRFVPNPDIPRDVNLVPFPINPRYTKLGTLDGIVGYDKDGKPVRDTDYKNANGRGEYSYFKPREAYALKQRIRIEQEQVAARYESMQYSIAGAAGGAGGGIGGSLAGAFAGGSAAAAIAAWPATVGFVGKGASNGIGAGILGAAFAGVSAGATLGGMIAELSADRKLPSRLAPRNLVNTYIWTADGGFYSESTNVMESFQQSSASNYAFNGSLSGGMNINITADVGPQYGLEMNGSMGGHFSTSMTRSEDKSRAFSLSVSVNVPGDLQSFYKQGSAKVLRQFDNDGQPVNLPGKVDAYRFMTFFLAPETENHDAFFRKVVDPIWLGQSDHPNAIAIRQAENKTRKPACWRVMHRVVFRSRVLPDFPDTTQAPSLDKELRSINFSSYWQLIKKLDPFLKKSIGDSQTFRENLIRVVRLQLPEIKVDDVKIEQDLYELMADYYGIRE